MMEKYAIIEFRSAKFIKSDGDVIITGNQYRKRTEDESIDNRQKNDSFISLHQISAMLHVLLGCRPQSYLRPAYNKSYEIESIAKNSLIKITSANFYTTKSGDNSLSFEITQGNKAPWDSHKAMESIDSNGNVYSGAYVTWDSFRKKFLISKNKDWYNTIISFIEKYYGDVDLLKNKMSLIDVLVEISKNEKLKNELLLVMEDIQLSSFKMILNGVTNLNPISNNIGYNLAAQTLLMSIVKKTTIDGIIYIPVTEKIGCDLMSGIGYATIGDGGLAKLKGIIYADEDDIIDENFIHIYSNN